MRFDSRPDALAARVRLLLPLLAVLTVLAFALNLAPTPVSRADDATTDTPAAPDERVEEPVVVIREYLDVAYARGGRQTLGMDLYLPPGPPLELKTESAEEPETDGEDGGEPEGEESGEADGDGTTSDTDDDAATTPADGPFPAIVFIHGGSWIGGTRDQGTQMCKHFAANGYVAATITYRLLTNGGSFPNPVHDCKAAIRHLKRNADLYRIDPERIAVIGASAGGHLALMVAFSTDCCAEGYCEGDDLASALDPGDVAIDVDTRVAAVVAIAPPTDFRLSEGAEGSIMQELLVRAFVSDGNLERASPITYVTEDDPPTLLFHCNQDSVVPYDQSVRLDAALAGAEVPHEFVRLDMNSHVPGGAERDRMVRYTQSFLDQYFRDKAHDPELATELGLPLAPPPAPQDDPGHPEFEEDF